VAEEFFMNISNSYNDISKKMELPSILSNPLMIIYSLLLLSICLTLFSMKMWIYAAILIGLVVSVVVFINPRIGILIAMAVQIIDLIYNPSNDSGLSWISAGRILAVISLVSYLVFKIRKPGIQINAINTSLLFFGFFVVWAIVCIPLALFVDRAVMSVFKLIVNLGITVAAIDLLSDKKLYKQPLIAVVMGAVIGSLIILFGHVSIHFNSYDRLDFSGVGVESVALSISLGIISAVTLIAVSKSVRMTIICSLSLIIMYIVLLRTGTRSALIGVPLSIMLAGLIVYWQKIKKLALVLAGVILFGMIIYGAINYGYITGELVDRVSSMGKNDTYSHNVRWKLWGVGIKTYLQHPLGVGPGHEMYYFKENAVKAGLYPGESHNTFISVLIEYGPIGLLLFLLGLTFLAYKSLSIKNPSFRFAALLCLIFCISQITKVTSHTARTFWQPITFVMILIETDWIIFRKKMISNYIREFAKKRQTQNIDNL
jgi:O-antigen ligase